VRLEFKMRRKNGENFIFENEKGKIEKKKNTFVVDAN
jgi:hypothetical protein